MKRFLTLFLVLCFTSVSLSAQESGTVKQGAADSVLYSTTFYFEKNQGVWIEKYEYVKASRLLKWAKANSSALIDIKGWADPSGTEELNARLSLKRAKTISRYLTQRGVDSSRITFESKGVDFDVDSIKARRADVVGYVRVENKEIVAPEPKEEVAKEEATKEIIEPEKAEDARAAEPNEPVDIAMAVEPEGVEAVADPSHGFSLRTNLLYWVGGLMNLGVEWNPANTQLGVVLNGGYSFLGGDDWEHALGGWFLSPELRYYIGERDQWFVGGQFLVGGYNVKLSDTGRQGNFIGGGVMGGYKIGLSDTFDMDFTLGVGYGTFDYLTYYHSNGVNVYKTKDLTKSCIVPIQAGVNLIWKIK